MRRLIALIALAFALALPVAAQDTATTGLANASGANAPDYAAWEQVATRAEAAVEAGRASNDALRVLRTEVVTWRGQFQMQLTVNDSRIATIREQISSLGPVPEDGTAEPVELEQRRAELNEQLTRLSTPVRTAEEALSRANGIISEIDAIIRTRQSEALLERGPSPVNPGIWPDGIEALADSSSAVWNEVFNAWGTASQRRQAQDNLPLILLLVAVALVLLLRSRMWMELLATRLERTERRGSAGFFGFAVSLGQIVFPFAGLFALLTALELTGLYGPRGALVLDTLIPMGVMIFIARWVGSRIFPLEDGLIPPLNLAVERRREGRVYATLLAVIFAASLLLDRLARFDRFSEEAQAVLVLPLVIFAALMIFRIGQLLRQHAKNETAASDDASQPNAEGAFRTRFIASLGTAARLVAFTAPIMAVLGYEAAASGLIFPFSVSLALLAFVMLLSRALRDLYIMIVRPEPGAEGLIPTLVSLVLLLSSLPVFALIWGAQVTDLTELWAEAREGLAIGDMRLSPSSIITLLVVFSIGYVLTRALQSTLRTSILPKTRLDTGGQNAVRAGVGYVGIFLSAIVAITAAGIDLSSLAIVAGALSVGIGFGLQNIVNNFVSGIILLIERPIAEGDWIEVGGQHGTVRNISVRSTRIETFDRTDVIVPNSDFISGTVTNYTRGNTIGRLIVPVGVAYGTDTRKVEEILREIAISHPLVLAQPAPMILFSGFGADSLDFEIRVILRDINWMLAVKNEFNHKIAERFVEEGIEIPFAQRDIWLRNPEALYPDRQKPPATPPHAEEGPTEEALDAQDVPDDPAYPAEPDGPEESQ